MQSSVIAAAYEVRVKENQSVEVQEHLPSQHGGEEAISNKDKQPMIFF